MKHNKSNQADMPRKMPSQSKKKRMMKDKSVPMSPPMSPKFDMTPMEMEMKGPKFKF